MELLTITLAANETKQFAKAGRYFEIIDSSYPLTVNFTGPNGAQSDSMVNALSGLYLEDPYAAFSITNGTIAQTITLLLMDIGRGGSRRQPGVVTVIDQAKKRSQSGLAFIGAFAPIFAAGGQNATLQLFNATNSGNRGYVSKISFYSATAQIIRLGQNDTILANITGVASNKNAGGAGSALIMCNESRVGTPPNFAFMGQYIIGANTTLQVAFDEPIILPLGRALVLQAVTVATDIGGVIEFTQEAV